MKKNREIVIKLFLASAIFFTACGGSSDDDDTSNAIKPDSTYTGSDCSCGKKDSDGSTMSISSSVKTSGSAFSNKKYVEGEVLVKFKDGTTQTRAAEIISSLGNTGVKSLLTRSGTKKSLLKRIILNSNLSVEQAVENYNSLSEVEYAEPNYIYKAFSVPNDPSYTLSWGLNNTGQSVNGTTGTSGVDINAEDAWTTVSDCSDVIVAVLDTGINYNHRDLSPNMWSSSSYTNHGYDFVDDDYDPMDMNGHGTHCAGVIGAKGNDSTGLAGICWNVQLMALRVLDATGSGTLADIAEGIDFAVAQGAHVISASLGGEGSTTLAQAVSDANDAGVIFVAAAGNEETSDPSESYPAAYSGAYANIISVAAVDQDGNLASFSNYGTWVDIAAPGVNIISTWPGQHVVTEEDFSGWKKEDGWGTGTYTYSDGTDTYNFKMLTNPSPFGGGNKYENNMSSFAYRVFDLNVYDASTALLTFYANYEIESNDHLYAVIGENGGRPNAWFLDFNGTTSGSLYGYGEIDIVNDLLIDITKNPSIGFALVTNTYSTYGGAGIAMFQISRLYHNTTACLYSDGTSMAAPHVSGVVAMCIQDYINTNGSYSKTTNYNTIRNAVLNGADNSYSDLSGKVESSRMLDAKGAIDEIL